MTHAEDLRRWAKGTYTTEAATELLLRAFNGRFAEPGNPWVRTPGATDNEAAVWIDFDVLAESAHNGAYSGGEARFLLLTASLAGNVHVVLADVLIGLDRHVIDLILAAVSHSTGSHDHPGISLGEDGTPTFSGLPTTLYPWPGDDDFR
ncbi:hypothetical protein [Paenarthrobacter nitroguajacolicus]|uniref:hypothetical protein n=1 Tax=Paenarthrobacter nitroguajacolicus TaxID=211146 RepID=UPI00248C64EE|nr:hypothetical protein [Paenarthrobacter nitroguajacolicus]MDI2037161.1 hypothetical protein [Paenarthrobacter nitroguajacolicus]